MKYDSQRALQLLRQGTGLPKSQFRHDQEEAIAHIVEARGRLLVVQKTGWGKSFVYFIAIKLLREQGSGPALLVSPLLSLMRDQIRAAERMGVRAVTINSGNTDSWEEVEAKIRGGEVDIVLISPERLANQRFSKGVLAAIADRISLLVIDEAHCISDWGHDFRPQYKLIGRMVRTLPPNVRLLCTTATANDRVLDDLGTVLGSGLRVMRGELSRPSLTLQTIRMPGQAERLAWLAGNVPALAGSGIIYTLTVYDADRVADWLKSRGLNVVAYTGQTGENRPAIEQALLGNKLKAVVATTALGMGFDKPDLAFVIHYQAPGSVVAYYQQVGRAGRAIGAAYGVLLSGQEDTEIQDYFIASAFPTRDEVDQVLGALKANPDGLSIREMERLVNVSRMRMEKAVELLSLESPAPIARQGAKWQLTASKLGDAFWERRERQTELRRTEQAQMQEYVQLKSGHMDFLIRALDGEPAPASAPTLPPLSPAVDRELVQQAVAFLRRSALPIEPRQQWPTGVLPHSNLTGKIKPDWRAQEGKVLSIWGDSGWGDLVRHGKYDTGRFADDLVAASASLIKEWKPQPRPTWVTCIPSRRHSQLVPDFARRLSQALGLPFHPSMDKVDDRPQQKEMANSAQQARNVDGALVMLAGPLPPGPVLLVDDMLDSGWTLTVASYLLCSSGHGPVFPFALAKTTSSQ